MRQLLRTIVAACLLAGPAYAQDSADAQSDRPAAGASVLSRINELIRDGELEQAKALLAETKDVRVQAQVRSALASAYMRARDYASAFDVFADGVKTGIANKSDAMNRARLGSDLSMLFSLAQRVDKLDEANALLDQAMQAVLPEDPNAAPTNELLQITGVKIRSLQMSGEVAAAKELASSMVAKTKDYFEAKQDDMSALMMRLTALGYMANADAVNAGDYNSEALAIAEAALESFPNNPAVASRYASAAYSKLGALVRSAPKEAQEELKTVREKITALAAADENVGRSLQRMNQMFDRLQSTIDSEMKLLTLVGTKAPELDIAYWAHGEEFTADDLKGKVVLLDFWAVWCGPCIATFPHLREWQAEYGDQGFQVVGVTRKYNYEWDAEAQRASRIEGENSDADEAAMLNLFMEHHELLHPTMVTPEGSTMQADYAVRGIPHAVLIDRQGVIRMIKVGSGAANAKALHDEIEKLLAE